MTDRSTVVEVGSGNVFADIGVPDAAAALAKADLALAFARVLEDRGLTAAAAAAVLGVTEQEVVDVLRGLLSGFSVDRLAALIRGL